METKKALIDYKEKNPAVTHEDLKDKFGLSSRKTVTDILSKSQKYKEAAQKAEANNLNMQRKKIRDTVHHEVCEEVLCFLQNVFD